MIVYRCPLIVFVLPPVLCSHFSSFCKISPVPMTCSYLWQSNLLEFLSWGYATTTLCSGIKSCMHNKEILSLYISIYLDQWPWSITRTCY
uniref:Secreted protein n=1 Tax=Pyxicephalus adspersus TaxID=30357 RepID=A0AAV2ZY53_PYXAD|nr:TPA: hypothetical protein GDO54_004208 [Pyxicephalus adspersus]